MANKLKAAALKKIIYNFSFFPFLLDLIYTDPCRMDNLRTMLCIWIAHAQPYLH